MLSGLINHPALTAGNNKFYNNCDHPNASLSLYSQSVDSQESKMKKNDNFIWVSLGLQMDANEVCKWLSQ